MREYWRRSGKMPTPFRELPEISQESILYWYAYLDLKSRTEGLVKYSEIKAYADIVGLNPTELMVKVHTLEDSEL